MVLFLGHAFRPLKWPTPPISAIVSPVDIAVLWHFYTTHMWLPALLTATTGAAVKQVGSPFYRLTIKDLILIIVFVFDSDVFI